MAWNMLRRRWMHFALCSVVIAVGGLRAVAAADAAEVPPSPLPAVAPAAEPAIMIDHGGLLPQPAFHGPNEHVFQAVTLPLAASHKKFNVDFVPYVRMILNFTQNLAGQDRNQTDVTIGNFNPDTGVVTETQPRGKLDTQFGVERMLFGVQMSYAENWQGGVELEAASKPQIGGANASGGSTMNLSLAYVQCDVNLGFASHSLTLGRIPTVYVSYFDEVLWQHRFVAPGLLERNGLEFRTDDGLRVDGWTASQSLMWSLSVTNGAPVGNEKQFDGGKSLSGMLVARPFDGEADSGLGGFRLLALVNVLDRASTGANPRISSAKRHLLFGMYYTGARFRCGFEFIPWGTRGRDARKPTSSSDGNVFGLSVWTVFSPQESWDVLVRLDVWDPNTAANNHTGVFIASPTATTTAPGQEQYYALVGVSRRFNPFVQGSLNLEFTDDSGKLQFTAAGAQKDTSARVDLSVRVGVTM